MPSLDAETAERDNLLGRQRLGGTQPNRSAETAGPHSAIAVRAIRRHCSSSSKGAQCGKTPSAPPKCTELDARLKMHENSFATVFFFFKAGYPLMILSQPPSDGVQKKKKNHSGAVTERATQFSALALCNPAAHASLILHCQPASPRGTY